jgi:hypothetical protein
MNAVIVFARYPENGKVKTRLGKTLGNEFAVGLYELMAGHIFKVCRALPKEEYDIHLFYDDKDNSSLIKKWAPSYFTFYLQSGNDLGERMKSAFQILFNKCYKKVIIIGTDCPQINVNLIVKAFNELSQNDLVIGPSNDGGYYLLGMNDFHPFLFDDIRWSSDEVFRKTEQKAIEKGLSLSFMPELIDIDTEDDLKNWLLSFNK